MIQNAKIVAVGVDYESYSKQVVERGHPDFSMSRGEIVSFAINPKRWLDGYKENESTEATDWGQLIECLAGLNGKFDERYAVAPAEYENDKGEKKPWNWNANACKQWREDQGEREIIKAETFGRAKDALIALRADPEISELFACSKKQMMVCGEWADKAAQFAIPVRCLIDIAPAKLHPAFGKWLCDFKTARNGNPDTWARVVDDGGYDIQAALMLDLYTAATKEDRTDFVHIVQENVKPYHVVKPFPALTSEFLFYGRAKYQMALSLYAQCLATNRWPSYSTGNRLVAFGCQYIGPDALWKYRETGGSVQGRIEYQPEPILADDRLDVPH